MDTPSSADLQIRAAGIFVFLFNTLVLNKCHDIMIEVLSCSCSKHYLKRIGFHKSIVRPPEVSCKIHVDEFVADNFLELRKRAKINCFVTTIINYREENVGRNEQKRWKQQSASQRSHVQGRLSMRLNRQCSLGPTHNMWKVCFWIQKNMKWLMVVNILTAKNHWWTTFLPENILGAKN